MLAAIVRLLETTLIRVGNDEYARDNDSYGLTTMLGKHVFVDGTTIRFGPKALQLRRRVRRGVARGIGRCERVSLREIGLAQPVAQ